MYGNVPRALWTRWSKPDEEGRILLACRCLLIDDGARRLLFETGIGAFFEPALRRRYGVVEERHVLLDSLAGIGLRHEDIDVVVLSHLHFDHAGGLLAAWQAGQPESLLFPRARFVVGKVALERARAPHPRDRASFVPGLLPLLEASGRLVIVDGDRNEICGEHITFSTTEGHTPGMLHARITGRAAAVTFCADLVPGVPWVHLPITMGYDRFPERLTDEKARLYADVSRERGWLFFTHDPEVAAARVEADAAGRWSAIGGRNGFGRGWDLDAAAEPEV